MESDEELVEIAVVGNEVEARLVVKVLTEDGIDATSDVSETSPALGGLPFESGHRVFVPARLAKKAREVLERYPHFKPPAEG
jgi:hypothetical protein